MRIYQVFLRRENFVGKSYWGTFMTEELAIDKARSQIDLGCISAIIIDVMEADLTGQFFRLETKTLRARR